MNQRVPDSGGLPLRAMVMVLLFLAVIFLLLGINAVMSGSDSSEQSSSAMTTTTPPATTSPAAPPKAEVRVFNVSQDPGAAQRTADRLTPAGWNVVEVGNLDLTDVTATTVFYTEAPGEKQSAEDVAKVLEVPPAQVQLRRPDVVDLPPGVIVAVTG